MTKDEKENLYARVAVILALVITLGFWFLAWDSIKRILS